MQRSKFSEFWKSLNSLPKHEKIIVKSFFICAGIGFLIIWLGIAFLLIFVDPIYTSKNLDPSAEILHFAVVSDKEVSYYQEYDRNRTISPGFEKLYICGELIAPTEQWMHYYVYRDGERYPIADKDQMVGVGEFCLLLDVNVWVPGLSHEVKILSGRKIHASRVFSISNE